MRSAVCPCLVLALIAGPAHAQTAPGEPEATLTLGIKQVDEGNFQAALLTLDAVARRLALEPATHAKELSQAYLYRGVALVGLGQEESAKGSFAAALQYDKTLRIGEDRFPPRVVRVFEAARLGKTKSVLLPPSGAAKKAGIGAGAVAAIVGGVLAAGGAAVAAAGGNTPPSAAISVAPEGQAIAGVTVTTLTASASDPDNDPLTYSWAFGDGAAGSGQTVTHVYANAGTFQVTLTVGDGRGGSASTSSQVVVGTLTGRWVIPQGRSYADRNFYELVQNGAVISGQASGPNNSRVPILGVAANPRDVRWSWSYVSVCCPTTPGLPRFCRIEVSGQVSSSLTQIAATESCTGCIDCRDVLTVTLVR